MGHASGNSFAERFDRLLDGKAFSTLTKNERPRTGGPLKSLGASHGVCLAIARKGRMILPPRFDGPKIPFTWAVSKVLLALTWYYMDCKIYVEEIYLEDVT